MSTSRAQDAQSAQAARRRKRKDSAKSRTPEPRNVVSGAGMPLDPGVRRELEERLGHDLGRVRLHTDRDAGALTEMLGADAVAVGEDVFFRDGAYRPGTAEGQRLLVHELLHTVQNPHGLGALRAGRDLGAVSLPQQAIEREAESAAQAVVADGEPAAYTGPVAERLVEGRSPAPGWLRYATVDADRRRLEELDPAGLLDRLVNGVERSLRGDPRDLSKRVRTQIARLSEEMQDAVLDRLEVRLPSPEHERLVELVEESGDSAPLPQDTSVTPEAVPDALERLEDARERPRAGQHAGSAEAAEARAGSGGAGADPGGRPEVGARQEDGRPRGEDGSRQEAGRLVPGTGDHTGTTGGGTAPAGRKPGTPSSGGQETGRRENSRQAAGTRTGDGAQAAGAQAAGARGPARGESASRSGTGTGSGSGSGSGKDGTAQDRGGQAGAKGADERRTGEEDSAGQGTEGAPEARAAARGVPAQDERPGADRRSGGVGPGSPTRTADPGARSTLEGRRPQDEEQTDEAPFGLETGPEGELGESGDGDAGPEGSAWDVELAPEDFVPETDLDVSGVPTADRLALGSEAPSRMPTFPEPPPTRAEQVQAEREEEDAEEDAAGRAELSPTAPDADGPSDPLDGPGAGRRGAPSRAGRPGGVDAGGSAGSPVATGTPEAAESEPRSARGSGAPSAADVAPGDARDDEEQARQEPEAAAEQRQSDRAASAGGSSPAAEQASAGGGGPAGAPSPGSAASGTAEGASADSGAVGGARPAPEPEGSGRDRPGGNTGTSPGAGTAGGDGGGPSPGTGPEPGTGSVAPDGSAPAPAADGPAARDAGGAGTGRFPMPAPSAVPAPPRPRAGGPAPRTRGGGGGTRSAPGAGGGGGARGAARGKPKRQPAAPDLSAMTPEAGLSTAAALKPHRALEALGGVDGAVERSVGEEHRELQGAPPSLERPAGAPRTLRGAPATAAPVQYSADPAAQVDAPEKEGAKVEGEQKPEGEVPGTDIEEPSTLEGLLAGGAQLVVGAVNGVADFFGADEDVIDSEAVVGWILDLPTEDEMLARASVGSAPGVGMEGETGSRADEQGSEVDGKGAELHAAGRDDASRDLGEHQIYPDVPQETLTSKVPAPQGPGSGAAGAAAAPAGRIPPEAVSEVAEHERGPQLRAAYGDGQRAMSEKRRVKDRDTRESRERHGQQVRTEIDAGTRAQSAERDRTRDEVTRQREEWRSEQDAELESLGTGRTAKVEKVRQDVKEREKKTDDQVEDRRKNDEKGIGEKSRNAERQAASERDTAKNDSGNWLSKAFDWIRDRLVELKNAIVRFFREARDAVVALITDFRDTVVRWIDEARRFIVDKFKEFTEALIQLAKDLLDAILEIAARIRALVIRIRDAAIALVNRIADELKRVINELLAGIAKLLAGILNALKEGLRLAVRAVTAAVKAAMDFATGLLNALGEWALIAADVIADPGGWLGGAAASAEDGARNHLFREITSAVRNWFNEKIQEVLGLPKQIFDALVNGGVSKEQMAKEAWDAALPQLPVIIGEIVVTKIIAKLIPGAGWVMAVIDALKSAWGALSEILRAFGAFMDYLKAVKGGNAGLLFAKAVASGVVALLELAYEALLSGIGKYVKKVGDRLRGVAANLKKPGEKDPAKPDRPRGDHNRKTPRQPDAPKDPARPNPPDRPQATERPKPGVRPSDRRQRAERARDGTRRAGDELKKRPARPARPGTRPVRTPARPDAGRPRPRGPETRRPDDRTRGARPDDRAGEPRRERPDRARPGDRARTGTHRGPERPAPARRAPRRDRDLGHERDTVRSALSRNRRARRALDSGDDRDTRRRRDLDHNDRRLRGAYRRRRELLQEQRRRQQEERKRRRDARGRREDSEESKLERLRRIAARVRPRIEQLLRKGVRSPVLRAVLAAMRLHYRLTSLAASAGERFDIRATLNPSVEVADGLTVDEQELIEMLNDISDEVLGHPATRAGAARIKPTGTTANQRNFLVPDGVGFASLAGFMREDGLNMLGSSREKAYDVFTFDDGRSAAERDPGDYPPMVAHHVPREPNRDRDRRRAAVEAAPDETSRESLLAAENLDRFTKRGLVKSRVSRTKRDGTTEEQNRAADRYRERVSRKGRVTKGIDEKVFGDPDHAAEVLDAIGRMARGERVGGRVGTDAAAVGALMLGKEVHRNRRAAVTAAMIFQMSAQGRDVSGVTEFDSPRDSLRNMRVGAQGAFDVGRALKFFPMEGQGAVGDALDLDAELKRRGPFDSSLADEPLQGGQRTADREILAIQMWIKSLDIKTDEGGRIRTLQQLRQQIRAKMFEFYGLR